MEIFQFETAECRLILFGDFPEILKEEKEFDSIQKPLKSSVLFFEFTEL